MDMEAYLALTTEQRHRKVIWKKCFYFPCHLQFFPLFPDSCSAKLPSKPAFLCFLPLPNYLDWEQGLGDLIPKSNTERPKV